MSTTLSYSAEHTCSEIGIAGPEVHLKALTTHDPNREALDLIDQIMIM